MTTPDTNAENTHARAAKDYSAHLAKTDTFFAPLYRQLIGSLAVATGNAVLDAGCGAGGFTVLLAAAVGDTGSVTALDVTPAHLAATETLLATTSHARHVRYQAGDVDALPFPPASFDLVWCSHVVHGQPDQLATARGLARVCRPGGRVVVREDLGLRHLIPNRVAGARSGLAQRVKVVRYEESAEWQAALPGVVPYPYGYTELLREAGCANVQAKTFLFELLPPLSDAQHAYLHASLDGLGEVANEHGALDGADRRALDQLADATSPHYLLDRPDFYYLYGATLYTGTVAPTPDEGAV